MQGEPRYPAKINRPIYRKILKRKRLFSVLDRSREPLVWVSGPAGSGKTTFISSYIKERKVPHIWYQVDDGDKDPGVFFHYLFLAHRKIVGDKESLPVYTPGFYSDMGGFAERVFEKLFQDLPPGSYFVLDSFPEDPNHLDLDLILQGLSRIPKGSRIVVISRTIPPPTTSILEVRGQMNHISARDLQLDEEEFIQAAEIHGLKGISTKTLEKIREKLEGWMAGLVLMAEGMRSSLVEVERTLDSSPMEISRFFAGEIWENIDEGTRNFLLTTSFLPRMTGRTAQEISGFKRAGETLTHLMNHNLFMSCTGFPEPVYQYHSLFRDFLQALAVDTLTEEHVRSIKEQAAEILRKSGQNNHAASLLQEIGAWETLSELIMERAPEMLSQGRHSQLCSWIGRLPETLKEGDTRINYLAGLCLLPTRPSESRSRFLRALDLGEEAGDAELSYLSWARAVDSVIYESHCFKDLDPLLVRKKQLDKRFPGVPPGETETAVALGMYWCLFLRDPGNPELDAWADRAVTLAEENGRPEKQIAADVMETLRHYASGNMFQSVQTAEHLLRSYGERDLSPILTTVVLFFSAFRNWVRGDLDGSLKIVEQGLIQEDIWESNPWEMQFLGQGAISALSLPDPGMTAEYLVRMQKKLGDSTRNDQALYHFLKGWALFAVGERALSKSHLEKGLALKREVGHDVFIARNLLALAMFSIAEGDRKSTAVFLNEAREISQRTGSVLTGFLCDMVESSASLVSGRRKKALEFLNRALEEGSRLNILAFCWLDRQALTRLLLLAMEEGIQTEYTSRLIGVYRLSPTEIWPDVEMWPWPVKIYSLGRFELVVKGKTIRFPRKAQERPLDLLKAILAFGGRKVSSDSLVEALWPDSDGATGHQTLATTLHRLRHLIDVPDAVIVSQGQVSLNPEVCWVDTWALERAMGQISAGHATDVGQKGEPKERLARVEKALEFYKGHFMSSDGSDPWIIGPRERLRSRFIRTLISHCTHLEQMGEDEQAVHWYSRALEMENLSEELYQGLIQCCLRLGHRANAMATYNRCRDTFSLVLGVEPSEKTEALRRKILEKDGD